VESVSAEEKYYKNLLFEYKFLYEKSIIHLRGEKKINSNMFLYYLEERNSYFKNKEYLMGIDQGNKYLKYSQRTTFIVKT
jgi:hypothetical protein